MDGDAEAGSELGALLVDRGVDASDPVPYLAGLTDDLEPESDGATARALLTTQLVTSTAEHRRLAQAVADALAVRLADADPASAPAPSGDSAPRTSWARRAASGMGGFVDRYLSRLAIIATVTTALVTVGLFVATRIEPSDVGRVLRGDLNVAVAEFVLEGPPGQVAAADLAATFADELASELDQRRADGDGGAPLTIDLLPPSETGSLDGVEAGELAVSAAAITDDRSADVVASAVISEDGRQVVPVLYVGPRVVADALELAGLHPFGAPIQVRSPIDDNRAARAEVRQELVAMSAGLAEFLIGLQRYENGDYEQAAVDFEQALDLFPADADRGLPLLYLGNTALKLGDVAGARSHYEEGLAADTAASRRLDLGLIETRFTEARGDCSTASASQPDLESVRADLERLDDQGYDTTEALLRIRTTFGRARAELCLALLGGGSHERASDLYATVLELIRSGDVDAPDLEAEALGGLGFVAAETGRTTWPAELCGDAPDCFERAAATALDDDRRQFFEQAAADTGALPAPVGD